MTVINSFDVQNLNLVAVVPVVIAIVQALKMVGLPGKFSPLVSLAIGIFITFLFNGSETLGHTILEGVVYGLSASGLYSGTKTTAHSLKEEKPDDFI